jgi:Rad3-related DNA helicase
MHFDLATRLVTLGVGEMATFALGPRCSRGGAGGRWRAQLGQHWHSELRNRSAEEPGARFEVPIVGDYPWRGWIFRLSGRIDQFIPSPAGGVVLRELKTVSRPLPAPTNELEAEYPEYFVQLAAYLVLHSLAPQTQPARGELVFIEAGSGFVQAVSAPASSAAILHGQLDEIVGFLDARRRACERRRSLPVRTAFAQLRPGQEHLQRDLRAALGLGAGIPNRAEIPNASAAPPVGGESPPALQNADATGILAVAANDLRFAPPPSALPSAFSLPPPAFPAAASSILCFEAPTGFGKTGCLLEFALTALKEGHYDRLVYLTGKSTGQLQVIHQLETMLAPAPPDPGSALPPISPSALSLPPSAATPPPSASSLQPSAFPHPPSAPRRPSSATSLQPSAFSLLPASPAARLPYWQVRSKAEHCVNSVYHCLPDACPYLAHADERWPGSGLARFYLLDGQPRDLESLRAAGRAACLCPYEITRAALPFNDVWVGDYNYVFAPANRSLFFEQPGFDPASTLLIVDEAHNLPARVADSYSHALRASDAWATWDALRSARAPAGFLHAWEAWARALDSLAPCEALDGATEIGLRSAAGRLAELVPATALDFVALGPRVSELLWQLPSLDEFLDAAELPKLLWSPSRGELRVTCLDAANAIAETLHRFRHAILTSATLNPPDAFAAACGLDRPVANEPSRAPASAAGQNATAAPTSFTGLCPSPPAPDPTAHLGKLPRSARKTLRGLTTAAALLSVEEEKAPVLPPFLRADTPWRRGAYRVAVDTRVDTRWERRTHHFDTTAATVAQLVAAANPGRTGPIGASLVSSSALESSAPGLQPATVPIAVFFPSYAYAESVAELCVSAHHLRIAQQPRGVDLAAQAEFIETSLSTSDALFLVLGTGYTEGIDLLGGRITHAMVVGPALPEVNAVQRAKLALGRSKSRDAAFRQVYQVPGMQKVNQALGRLVRAPGQHATVLLHCRRFAEKSYRDLLDPELQNAPALDSDECLTAWLSGHQITE